MAVNQVFKKLSKYYHENKLSHVYLLETNDEEKCLSDLLELIKEMSCMNNYKSDCNACNISHLIDENGFPDVMIVRPHGKNIKKEQSKENKCNTNYIKQKESIKNNEHINYT